MTVPLPPWAVMWLLGVATFFAVKIGTMLRATGWTAARLGEYGVGTATLDPRPFVRPKSASLPTPDWWQGLVGLFAAAVLWLVMVPAARLVSDWAAGVLAMAGVVCGLHFGAMHLMTAGWRLTGRDVRPLMQRPWRSETLAEFWGRRWNVAFRDASHLLIVQPLKRRLPVRWITAAVFLASGLIHEFVMSTPAGGWGGPTAYFLIQFAGVSLQRTGLAERLRLTAGWGGTLATAAVILLPLPLLFHRPFSEQCVLPFYDAVVSLAGWDGRWPEATLVRAGGWMQWSILLASACVPAALDWRGELAKLPPLLRQMFWVYGAYVVGAIVALGGASVFFAEEVARTRLGTAVAAATLAFWGVRFLVGVFWFDAKPFLTSRWFEAGYALLTVGFVTLTALYGFVAIS